MIKILCGDFKEVLSDVAADLIFTSPPYNIGSKSKRIDGFRRQGLYDPKSYGAIRGYSDDLPESVYQEKQREFLCWAAAHLRPNGIIAYNHKPRRRNKRMIHPYEWFSQVQELTLMEEIVWDRGSTHNHCNRLLWPCTERIYVFRRACDDYKFLNTKDLGFRSDIWRLGRARSNGHNAPFPEKLAEAVIKAWCPTGGMVVDPYCGSGTTAVVAQRLGRNFAGAEILKKYWKMAVERTKEREAA